MKRSLMLNRCEAATREGVRVLNEEWLVRRITPTKREEANDGCVEIDLSPNEPLSPRRTNQERTSEH